MSAHTPGPWRVMPEEVDRPYIRIRGTALGGRYKVADVPTPTYDGVAEREAKETRGNARLIAAAPELLEALKLAHDHLALTHYSVDGKPSEVMQAINAAIAKATGATP